MNFFTWTHPEQFFVLPTITLEKDKCPNTECDAEHWMVSVVWFCWSAGIAF